jgi:hypothetical protein
MKNPVQKNYCNFGGKAEKKPATSGGESGAVEPGDNWPTKMLSFSLQIRLTGYRGI